MNQDEASLSLLVNRADRHGIERVSGHSLLLLHSPVVMVPRSDFRQGWEGEVGWNGSNNCSLEEQTFYIFVGKICRYLL